MAVEEQASFGGLLRRYRAAAGLSQEALAALAGLDRSYVSSVERGLRNVSVLNLARIAAVPQYLGLGPVRLTCR